MADSLMYPGVIRHVIPDTDYYLLNGMSLSDEERLNFLGSYITLIDSETRFEPATPEFVKHFNSTGSIDIIKSFSAADNFFNTMIHGDDFLNNLHCYSPTDIYFMLIELKFYIEERRAAIVRNKRAKAVFLIENHKNHFSFNPLAMQKVVSVYESQKFSHSVFFVPETVLFNDNNISLTVCSAIKCINMLITDLQSTSLPYIDLEIYSFLMNYKNMLFNNEHDNIHPDTIAKSIDYVHNLTPGYKPSSSEQKCICQYALFTRCLFIFARSRSII